MKKCLSMFLCLAFMCFLGFSNVCAAQPAEGDPGALAGPPSPSKSADVDLTILSNTMVFAELSYIMANPDNYIGKTIKVSGPYSSSYYDATNQYYHYVIIQDGAACCQQGLEFIWNGEHTYPDDYPKEKTWIEVVGVFGRYEELEQTYNYLAVDDITIKN